MRATELPETEYTLLHARDVAQAKASGQPFADPYYGIGAFNPGWAEWARQLPDYANTEIFPQAADGTFPFILELVGLGDAPLG